MSPRYDRDAQRVLDAVRRIVRALRVSARSAQANLGLSAAQLFVLERLKDESRLSLGELAARTHTDPSSVSVVVRKLVEQGLVSRMRATDDERRLDISLTKQGRRVLLEAPTVAQERLLIALRELSVEKREQLAALLEEVVSAMGLTEGSAPMFFEDEPARSRSIRKRTEQSHDE